MSNSFDSFPDQPQGAPQQMQPEDGSIIRLDEQADQQSRDVPRDDRAPQQGFPEDGHAGHGFPPPAPARPDEQNRLDAPPQLGSLSGPEGQPAPPASGSEPGPQGQPGRPVGGPGGPEGQPGSPSGYADGPQAQPGEPASESSYRDDSGQDDSWQGGAHEDDQPAIAKPRSDQQIGSQSQSQSQSQG